MFIKEWLHFAVTVAELSGMAEAANRHRETRNTFEIRDVMHTQSDRHTHNFHAEADDW